MNYSGRFAPESIRARGNAFAERLERVMKAAKEIELCNVRHRGGYFILADSTTGLPLCLDIIGHVYSDEQSNFLKSSIEMADRLAKHPSDQSSWKSRNPVKKEWGGAVRTHRFIFSFAGFPERVNEAIVLATAVLGSELSEEEALDIAEKNRNMFYLHLLDAYSQLDDLIPQMQDE